MSLSSNSEKPVEYTHPSLFRRLAAIIYDSILLVAIVMICFIPVPILSESFRQSVAGKLLLQVYILLILFVFYGWFWTHRGQTLGMRAWRIMVVKNDGSGLTWAVAFKRFLICCVSVGAFGLGLILCLFHPKNMSFHDLYSGSKLIMVEKKIKTKSGNSP